MKEKEILAQYLPPESVEMAYQWIIEHKIHFKISKTRRTKLGDYRPPIRHPNHRITINHDLNPYAFLVTFVHEVAHLKVYNQYRTQVSPHGIEWKLQYSQLMQPFLQNGSFPEDVKKVLIRSLKNSKASSTSDIELTRVLQGYDKLNGNIHLEKLETETIFNTENGKIFKKGERIRTRYKCLNLNNNKYYLFHPLTPVAPVLS